MDQAGSTMQAMQGAYPSMQNSYHQSYQVPNNSAYAMTQHQVNSDPCRTVNLASGQQQQYGQPAELDPRSRSVIDLLEQLSSVTYKEGMSDTLAQERKEALNKHPLMPILRAIFRELKEEIHGRVSCAEETAAACGDKPPNEQLMRLDNMLIAEGVAEPEAYREGSLARLDAALKVQGIENQDYRNKLNSIKTWYHAELANYQDHCNSFADGVKILLGQQCAARPITAQEVARTVDKIRSKFQEVEIQLKQQTCEAVMSLRSRFLDARRKRRNFSKQASDILNAYFYAHLHNPYPSELVKEQLARQCDITVSQVSNWFGNKRIRYKKNAGKGEEEANVYACKKLPVTMTYEPTTMTQPPPPPPPPTPMAATPLVPTGTLPYDAPANNQQHYQMPHYSTNTPVMGYDNFFSQQRTF